MEENDPVLAFLPDPRYWHKLSRCWVINVYNSVDQAKFKSYVDKGIKDRDAKVLRTAEKEITIPQEFADALGKSTHSARKCIF